MEVLVTLRLCIRSLLGIDHPASGLLFDHPAELLVLQVAVSAPSKNLRHLSSLLIDLS